MYTHIVTYICVPNSPHKSPPNCPRSPTDRNITNNTICFMLAYPIPRNTACFLVSSLGVRIPASDRLRWISSRRQDICWHNDEDCVTR